MSEKWTVVSENRVFGGHQRVISHYSETLGCETRTGLYIPPQAKLGPCPILYWLSGLTCTEQNFLTKAGAQAHAARHGVIVVAPDTSPRGDDVADDDGWDLGQGAGFYVNATQDPWAANYNMYDYVVKELPELIEKNLLFSGFRGIFGHSMGGHGALAIALKNPDLYCSASAFSPIVAPTQVPWGQKAFSAYLGDDKETWKAYDTCELVRKATKKIPILVDQGVSDSFQEEQLRPELLEVACREADYPLELRRQPGYDHSYYFISTFIGDHFAHHVPALNGG